MLYTSRHTSIVSIGLGISGGALSASTIKIEGELKDRIKKLKES
ncbi:hypothetical protein [Halobacillus locisalis]|nr:hypothetical protein [Halobacillus locisalis]